VGPSNKTILILFFLFHTAPTRLPDDEAVKFVYFDLETTGLSKLSCEIVQASTSRLVVVVYFNEQKKKKKLSYY